MTLCFNFFFIFFTLFPLILIFGNFVLPKDDFSPFFHVSIVHKFQLCLILRYNYKPETYEKGKKLIYAFATVQLNRFEEWTETNEKQKVRIETRHWPRGNNNVDDALKRTTSTPNQNSENNCPNVILLLLVLFDVLFFSLLLCLIMSLSCWHRTQCVRTSTQFHWLTITIYDHKATWQLSVIGFI